MQLKSVRIICASKTLCAHKEKKRLASRFRSVWRNQSVIFPFIDWWCLRVFLCHRMSGKTHAYFEAYFANIFRIWSIFEMLFSFWTSQTILKNNNCFWKNGNLFASSEYFLKNRKKMKGFHHTFEQLAKRYPSEVLIPDQAVQGQKTILKSCCN